MAVTPNPQSKILAAGCLPPLPKFPTVLPPYPSTHPNHSSITHIHLLVVSPFDSPSTLPKTPKGDLFECSSSNRSRPCHAGQVRPYCQQDPATVMLIASFSDLEKALRRNGHNWQFWFCLQLLWFVYFITGLVTKRLTSVFYWFSFQCLLFLVNHLHQTWFSDLSQAQIFRAYSIHRIQLPVHISQGSMTPYI